MNYLVLARKWRPRAFSDVIGQDHVTLTLKKAVEKERLAHAYLFSGPRGCGKTSTARLLAKVINCEDRQGCEPCDKCSSCVAVNEGNHLDMIEIDGASNRGIDEIRDLREKIGYASSQGSSKIYIIDEVHMLTPQAFNALLKTLEEPPSHVYLIFATTEPHKVPATILSRCQRFNFKRLELSELSGQLKRICSEEGIGFDEEALVLISRRADGSMRDAESLLDQCISALEEKVDLETVRRVLGLVDSQIITSLLEAISARDRKKALQIVDQVVSSGMDIEEFFLAYLEGIRNLMILSIGGDDSTEWLDLTRSEIEELRAAGSIFRTEDLLLIFRCGARSFRELKGSSHPRYHLEAAVAEAASWESAVEVSELLRKIDGGSGRGTGKTGNASEAGRNIPAAPRGGAGVGQTKRKDGGDAGGGKADGASIKGKDLPSPKEKSEKKPAVADEGSGIETGESDGYAVIDRSESGVADHDDMALVSLGGKEQWERFLAQVRESKLTLGIWLMSARVAAVDEDRIRLAFSSQNRFACEMVREEKNKKYIETHLERYFGRKLFIETGESAEIKQSVKAEAGPSGKKKSGKSKRDTQLEKLIREAPMVGRLIEEFDGELYKD